MKFLSIQFLRAVAVLLVIYIHSIDLLSGFAISKQQQFFYLENFGAIGVDLFFVISGFIISHIANGYSGNQQAAYFLKKRFLRINPVYYVASLIFFSILLIQWFIKPEDITTLTGWPWHKIADTITIIPLFKEQYYAPVLFVGWTLIYEWIFYLLFVLLILGKIKNKIPALFIIVPTLALTGYFARFTDIRLASITNHILLEFLYGVAAWWVYKHIKRIPVFFSYGLVIAGIAGFIYLIIAGFGSISESYTIIAGIHSGRRSVLFGLPCACLVAGCIFLEKENKWKNIWRIPLMQLLGDASFSIYLVHIIIFHLVRKLYLSIGFLLQPDMAVVVQLIIAVAFGIFFYKFVEKPLLHRWHIKKTGRLVPL